MRACILICQLAAVTEAVKIQDSNLCESARLWIRTTSTPSVRHAVFVVDLVIELAVHFVLFFAFSCWACIVCVCVCVWQATNKQNFWFLLDRFASMVDQSVSTDQSPVVVQVQPAHTFGSISRFVYKASADRMALQSLIWSTVFMQLYLAARIRKVSLVHLNLFHVFQGLLRF